LCRASDRFTETVVDASFDALLGVNRSLTDLVAPTESAPAREVVLARPPSFCESISRSKNGGMLPVDAHAGATGGRMMDVTVMRSLREAARAEAGFRGVFASGRGRIG
jgi:hypothetical protein